jgi:hypothetical protein
MAKKSQTKGSAGEREVVALLSDRLGVKFERNTYRQRMEAGHYDVVGLDWLALEVKRYRKCSQSDVRAWWVETCLQADWATQVPVLFYRGDRCDWRAVVPLGWIIKTALDVSGVVLCDRKLIPAELTVDGFCDLVRPLIKGEHTGLFE